MIEATSNDPLPVNPESNPEALAEALQMIGRLASLTQSKIDLDATMTSAEAAAWLKVSVTGLNAAAKANEIPAIPWGNQFRFHPRTILDAGHRRFFKK